MPICQAILSDLLLYTHTYILLDIIRTCSAKRRSRHLLISGGSHANTARTLAVACSALAIAASRPAASPELNKPRKKRMYSFMCNATSTK